MMEHVITCCKCGKEVTIAGNDATQEVLNELLQVASFICDECTAPIE